MSFINTNGEGESISPVDPMDKVSGPNISSNNRGVPNNSNFFTAGNNDQSVETIRTTTQDTGQNLGLGSGTIHAYMKPMKGSSKLFIRGSAITGTGDMGMTNNNNSATTQCTPSQLKCLKND
jgi:hypothetical protein